MRTSVTVIDETGALGPTYDINQNVISRLMASINANRKQKEFLATHDYVMVTEPYRILVVLNESHPMFNLVVFKTGILPLVSYNSFKDLERVRLYQFYVRLMDQLKRMFNKFVKDFA
jgi:hypothetical protein